MLYPLFFITKKIKENLIQIIILFQGSFWFGTWFLTKNKNSTEKTLEVVKGTKTMIQSIVSPNQLSLTKDMG